MACVVNSIEMDSSPTSLSPSNFITRIHTHAHAQATLARMAQNVRRITHACEAQWRTMAGQRSEGISQNQRSHMISWVTKTCQTTKSATANRSRRLIGKSHKDRVWADPSQVSLVCVFRSFLLLHELTLFLCLLVVAFVRPEFVDSHFFCRSSCTPYVQHWPHVCQFNIWFVCVCVNVNEREREQRCSIQYHSWFRFVGQIDCLWRVLVCVCVCVLLWSIEFPKVANSVCPSRAVCMFSRSLAIW